jgi:hypothetical protein
MKIKHVCGGSAYISSDKLTLGWHLCCCMRCGEVFYYWVSENLLKILEKAGD